MTYGSPPRRPVLPRADVDAHVLDLGPAGLLLTSVQARADVLRALEGSIRAQRAKGYAVPERVAALVDVLQRSIAAALADEECRTRQAAAAAIPDPSVWAQSAGPLTTD
ncbi:hypothetical protein [Geodermatophilus sp. URMC 62]|uniref:hypothetical protein n=1 Tax=Geodermatophilus sp. URMC 62 TaxID=3423414 RepID=UPI00406C53B3